MSAALERLPSGSGSLFLLAGEPGIGKTRLATEVGTRARERGLRTVWGQCWEAGGAPVLWPWREAIEGLGLAFPDPGAITIADLAEARFALFQDFLTYLREDRTSHRRPIVCRKYRFSEEVMDRHWWWQQIEAVGVY